jgi:hypothetical protein
VNVLTPSRRRGRELTDDPAADPRLVLRTLDDVATANRLFGGTRAVLQEIREWMTDDERATNSRSVSMLDVGSGLGDIPRAVQREVETLGFSLEAVELDSSEVLLRSRERGSVNAVTGSALALPFPDKCFEVVMCSQVLHHFADADASRLLVEMNRVASERVIVSDLRRSWFAAAGLWITSYPLRFHPVSRHDGVLSVLRGYTGGELTALVRGATGAIPRVSQRAMFRITASWNPGPHSGSI